jgi:hypothetical protein
MSAYGYKKKVFRRLRSTLLATLSAMLVLSTAKADIIFSDHSNIQLELATFKPIQELKIDHLKSKLWHKNSYNRFAQESAENGTPALSVFNTPGKDEKSVEYVQAKHFRHYVMPNSPENPSEIDRITLSHQASGTQSRMLVMTK